MPVRLTERDGCAVLVLDRPEALNALSFSVIDEIADALDEAEKMAIRALVVIGAGDKAFCAGADIKELPGRSMEAQRRALERGQAVFARLDAFPVASVAMINGYAFGGGLELALACTFRLATPRARMGLPEIKLGLIPGYGGTQRLPRAVGEARALEMIMTGRTIDAVEAERFGLVNRVIEGDPLEGALTFAREFTCYGLPALRLARDATRRALDLPIHEGLKIEADLSTLAYQTADSAEGIAAFAEKRKPEFRDA